MTVVNEPGLYTLILSSRKPEAKAFKRWITHDVIPMIRKTGGYMTDSLLERIQKEPAVIVEFAQALILEKNRVKALECELITAKPKADYYDAFIVADGLFCREIDGLFCRSSPDIIVRRRCVLSHKRRGWLQPSPSFRYSRNLALQDELYHPVINNGPAVLVCVDKRLGTGPVNQSRDAG